jgi:hypothetical protein
LPPVSVRRTTGAFDSVIKFATEALFENFRIGDDLLAGREYFFDHFTAPTRISFGAAAAPPSWRLTSQASPTSPRISSACKSARALRTLLAYEKEVNEGFAKTA